MKRSKTQKIVLCAMIAAIYAAVSLALAPISFGQVQARVSEALTILPAFAPFTIIGLTVGCFLTNLVGLFMGANILGGLDLLFGTAATLIAAILSWKLGKIRWKGIPVLSSIPPIVVNAVIIGWELMYVTTGWNLSSFLLNMALVGLGQLVSCGVLGLILAAALEKTGAKKKLFPEDAKEQQDKK